MRSVTSIAEADLLKETVMQLTGLTAAEIAPLNDLQLTRLNPHAVFSAAFKDLKATYVDINGDSGLSSAQLSRNTIPDVEETAAKDAPTPKPELPYGTISSMENGFGIPTTKNLRGAINGFRKGNNLDPELLEEKLERLAAAAGWTLQSLFANAEEVVLLTHADAPIRKLLQSIRLATNVDLNQLDLSKLMSNETTTVRRDILSKYECGNLVPTPEFVGEFLKAINTRLTERGEQPLSDEAMGIVMNTARRDYSIWDAMPYPEKSELQHRGPDDAQHSMSV